MALRRVDLTQWTYGEGRADLWLGGHPRLAQVEMDARAECHIPHVRSTLAGIVSAKEMRVMAVTYNPGEIVPKDGTVECTQFNGTRDNVKKDTKFAPCDHWGDHHPKKGTWQYI